MNAVTRADRRDIGSHRDRTPRNGISDRGDWQGRQDETGGERRRPALLALAPVFGLAIWGALIALVI